MEDFFDFVVVVIIISSVISAISKAKKAVLNQQEADKRSSAASEELRRKLEEAKRMRGSAEEAIPPYTPQVAPHVAPHAPTVHPSSEDVSCEAHKRPESSEGSPVRAHVYTTEITETSCDAHREPVSTEGETREQRLERLRRQKAERDRQLAFDARYDEMERQSRIETRIRKPEYEKTKLSFSDNAVLQGIVYSEILKPPVCKRTGR